MKKSINYKVQKEEWEEAKNQAFKKIGSKLRVDGFRPGKAPRNLVEKNYPGKIVMEAADTLVDKEYRRLLIEEKIMPVIEPKIDIVKLTDDEACEIIRKETGLERISLIETLPYQQRNQAIRILLDAGGSLRQINRLTGVSIRLIRDIKDKSK